MDKYPKCIVALTGNRDHYQVPISLMEEGLLHSLLTDFYWPADTRWFQYSVGKVIRKSVLDKRFSPHIPSDRVKVSRKGLLLSAANRLFPVSLSSQRHREFVNFVQKEASKELDIAFFSYSQYALGLFESYAQELPYRFLFQFHPAPIVTRDILLEEIEHVPLARDSLQAEGEVLNNGTQLFDLYVNEAASANGWVAASRFTALTLAEQGVPIDKIHIIPYGVDHSAFPRRKALLDTTQPFSIIFVGQMVQRKGLFYLLEAVRQFRSKQVKLILCGRGTHDRALLAAYDDLNIEIHDNLPHHELVHKLHRADIFVLPSLVEGFGHVILEAMACGVPVITTVNTCGPDIIEDGVHGFVIPIRSAQAITEKLQWAIDNRCELAQMGLLASERARNFTWERFRIGIRHAYREMVNSVNASKA